MIDEMIWDLGMIKRYPFLDVKVAQRVLGILMSLDPELLSHSLHTQKLALLLGRKMALSRQELQTLALGALLHDVGKSLVTRSILNKVDKLTDEEKHQKLKHPLLGYGIARDIGLDDECQEIILNHHRWANGWGGYPIREEREVPSMLTRIVTVADVYTHMNSKQTYRRAYSRQDCLEYLVAHSGTKYDTNVVKVLPAATVRPSLRRWLNDIHL